MFVDGSSNTRSDGNEGIEFPSIGVEYLDELIVFVKLLFARDSRKYVMSISKFYGRH
jgi:hypothetical protein